MHAVRKLEVEERFKHVFAGTELLANFSTIHALVEDLPCDVSRIDSNLQITATAALTRSRPNAFNFVHQANPPPTSGPLHPAYT